MSARISVSAEAGTIQVSFAAVSDILRDQIRTALTKPSSLFSGSVTENSSGSLIISTIQGHHSAAKLAEALIATLRDVVNDPDVQLFCCTVARVWEPVKPTK